MRGLVFCGKNNLVTAVNQSQSPQLYSILQLGCWIVLAVSLAISSTG